MEQLAGHGILYLRMVDSTFLGYFDMHGISLVFREYHVGSPRIRDYHARHSLADNGG
jgi:hypothetical protein